MSKAIEVSSISYSYVDKKTVFENISFQLSQGEFVGLLGKNGSGKTTIMEMLIGFRFPDHGSIKIFNELTSSKEKNYISNIAFLSHDIQINPDMVISDFFNHHAYFFENHSKEMENQLCETLKINSSKNIGDLSTGEKKKVQIISALSSNAPLIIIDEVTAVLDPKTREDFFNLLSQHNKEFNKTILLATNIVDDLQAHCQKIIFLDQKNAEEINPNEINKTFHIKDNK